MKYTPSWIWNAEPVTAASFPIVVANGDPAAMEELPRRPDEIISLQVKFSPSEKTWVELLVVLELR